MPGFKSHSTTQGYHDPTDAIAKKGFYIEVFHINSGKTVRFKAMLKDYNDLHNVAYDDHFFIGQSEPVKKWKSTIRQIDLSFVALASSISEGRHNLAKVSLLTNMLYSEQEMDQGAYVTKVGGSPIFRIRLLNLIAGPGMDWGEAWDTGLQGYISNLMYKINTENSVFFHRPSLKKGRNLSGKDDYDPKGVYPQEMQVSFTFHPVYERSPAWINGSFYVNGRPVNKHPYGVDTTAAAAHTNLRGTSNKTLEKKENAANLATANKKINTLNAKLHEQSKEIQQLQKAQDENTKECDVAEEQKGVDGIFNIGSVVPDPQLITGTEQIQNFEPLGSFMEVPTVDTSPVEPVKADPPKAETPESTGPKWSKEADAEGIWATEEEWEAHKKRMKQKKAPPPPPTPYPVETAPPPSLLPQDETPSGPKAETKLKADESRETIYDVSPEGLEKCQEDNKFNSKCSDLKKELDKKIDEEDKGPKGN